MQVGVIYGKIFSFERARLLTWIPAFAGMTKKGRMTMGRPGMTKKGRMTMGRAGMTKKMKDDEGGVVAEFGFFANVEACE